MNILRKKWIWAVAIVIAALLIWIWPFIGPLMAYLNNPKRTYHGSCLDNLRNIGEAMRLYVLAEDAYPPKGEWMDKLKSYLRAADMAPEEQEKKLHCPDTQGDYGYAFNGALRHPVASPDTAIVYDSEKRGRNAFDDEPLASLPTTPRKGGNNALFGDGRVGPAKR
jgi:hypothetical protein